MKTRKMSISSKICLYIIVLTLACSVLITVLFYKGINRFLKTKYQMDAYNTVQMICNNIDGDAMAKVEAAGQDSDEYNYIRDELTTFLCNEEISYLYTLRYENEDYCFFLVDSDTENPTYLGYLYETEPAMLAAWAGETSVTEEPTIDEWGYVYSAYAPVYSSNGEIVAVVGLDIDVSTINAALTEVIKSLIVYITFAVIICAVLAVIIGRGLFKNFVAVNSAVCDVTSGEGDLTKRLEIESGDELEVIGNNFNDLLSRTRETISGVIDESKILYESMEHIKQNMDKCNDEVANVNQLTDGIVKGFNTITETMEQTASNVDDVCGKTENISSISEDSKSLVIEINNESVELLAMTKSASEVAATNIQNMSAQLDSEREKANSLEKINELSKTILDISDQTNLLALNANIEAARAGEAGKGFSVVAQEIGALASNSNDAANEIQQMSKDVLSAVEGLESIATSILKYISDTILPDYERFSQSCETYSEKTEQVKSNIDMLTSIMDDYFQSMKKMKEEITDVSVSIQSDNESIREISEVVESLQNAMADTIEITNDTVQSVTNMNDNVLKYKV